MWRTVTDTNPVKSISLTEEISVGSQRKQLGWRIDAAIQTGDLRTQLICNSG